MKYHITLARNDVIGKVGSSRSPCSLDDFNISCTAVIAKKKNCHAKFSYATHLNAPTWLRWFNIFKNLFLPEYLKKKGLWGLLSTWRLLFTFCEKRVFVRDFTHFWKPVNNWFLWTYRARTVNCLYNMSCSIKVGYKKKILETNRLHMWKRSVFRSYSRFFMDEDCV